MSPAPSEDLGKLDTEAPNPASAHLDELSPLEIVRLMNADDRRVADAVGAEAEGIARAIEVVAERLARGGRLIYAGAGTSGRLGVLDAAECVPTFDAPPGQVVGLIAGGTQALTMSVEGAEDDFDRGRTDLPALAVEARDVVVGIAASGRTPWVLGVVAQARAVGAFTIGLSCQPGSPLGSACDLAITPRVGPEVLTGSTRLKAGTATKMVLNMLSTGAFVRLGKVHGNLMVELVAANQKLRDRALRILMQLAAISREEAGSLLGRCDGELKTALVARLREVTPEQARALLSQAGGRVRAALETPT